MRAILTIVCIVAVCGCGRVTTGRSGEGPLVVASFYPLEEAVERVAGPAVDVVNLTPAGVEPHDLELSPADVASIAEADVVVYVGGGFQPSVEDALGETSGTVVDVLQVVRTLPAPSSEPGQSVDPHVWLDPTRYRQIVDRVAEALEVADPGSAGAFTVNAGAFGRDLLELASAYATGLENCRSRIIVSSHAAFAYLADAYGLRQEAIAGISPEAEADPRRLADLSDLVRSEGVTTVFTEEMAPPDVAQTLAEEAGVDVAVLNPLEGLTPDEVARGDDYRSVMERNLEVLRDGLGCS